MGCDIHGLWELKLDDMGHRWVGLLRKNRLEWLDNFERSRAETYLERPLTINRGRNYTWFGLVADVRRAGCLGTSARGLPEDVSTAWLKEVEDWEGNMHSNTWLTYDEVVRANRVLGLGEDWEIVPEPHHELLGLLVGYNEVLPWPGTLDKLLRGRPMNEVLRYVIGFDN